ncbi:PREDICTED: protein singed [Eufriesea mexicana]|uniref:protein singed n=1 Tax=Eufriesea mexicana TaxID=516756 RepID=UPI00083C8161|nr:PREDICTED: protein singed [Eufriesea mexicana]
MQANSAENVGSESTNEKSGWTVGLINGKFKYLTAETFGFKINANGSSLKKKQLWTLEGSEQQVYLRSHLDRYLAVDQFGNVTCEAEDPSDPGCAFQIQLASDGSGRWALKNIQRGYFLGSSLDELKCMAKAPSEAEYWLVHLAARPQVNLKSAGRKRFAHLSATQDEIHVDAPVPWGEDTLFTLEFRPSSVEDDGQEHSKFDGGHYALHTCNNKYLARDGKLLDSCTRDCLYAAEFHAGLLALRDLYGAYLAPIGSKAVLKSRSTTVTRDELFSLEESLPQASFVAALNHRYVSVKQGVDVTANQDEISGHETFQLEFDRVTKRWYVRTMQDRYWSLEAGGGIQASEHKRSSNALFDLIWQSEDGTVALRANNGKFVATKRSGHLYANADSVNGLDSDASKYYFYLMNRPVLVLRCEQGFVGPKSATSLKLECNKAIYETIRVERFERGIIRFKGQNGKYWLADSEGVTVDSDIPYDGLYLQLREPSRICIKHTDGRYLTAGKNGALHLGDTDYESATKWEF